VIDNKAHSGVLVRFGYCVLPPPMPTMCRTLRDAVSLGNKECESSAPKWHQMNIPDLAICVQHKRVLAGLGAPVIRSDRKRLVNVG